MASLSVTTARDCKVIAHASRNSEKERMVPLALRLICVISIGILCSGCQSEVDKCAAAMQRDLPGLKEGAARVYCLKAQKGGD